MIHVLAFITAKPGKRADILSAFNANVPAVLKEDGCIEYGPAVDVSVFGRHQELLGDDTFVVVEKWESGDALLAHASSAHMAAYAAKVKDLIADRKVHVLDVAK